MIEPPVVKPPCPVLTFIDVWGIAALVALHVWGLVTYIFAQVLTPTWLWENQDYMMFLWPIYYHVHIALLIGHLYFWGPLLIARQYRRPSWFLYTVSFVCAYILTGYPLLSVERFAALHGAAANVGVEAYYVILVVLFVYRLARLGSAVDATGFHLFSGMPIILLGLSGRSTLGIPNGIVVWGLLAFHVLVWFYVLLPVGIVLLFVLHQWLKLRSQA